MSDRANLRKSLILCKFYSLDENSIERICEATNTQLKISLSDLRSNDEIQKILEKLLETQNILYRRKRARGVKETITMENLAQWIYSCKYEKPADAKNFKSRLFEFNGLYQDIFNLNSLSVEFLRNIISIGLSVRKFIRTFNKKKKAIFERDADLHYISSLYYLRNKPGTDIAKIKKITSIIKRVIKKLRNKHGKDYSNNKIFTKNKQTWTMIKNELMTI